MAHETCPHCGQNENRSSAYRCGQRAGEKILEKCAGDEKKRAGWLRFLTSLDDVSRMVPQDISEYLQAARATIETPEPAKK